MMTVGNDISPPQNPAFPVNVTKFREKSIKKQN